MTRSIFDPTGDPERSGSRNLGPDAREISQLPPRYNEDIESDDDERQAGSQEVVDDINQNEQMEEDNASPDIAPDDDSPVQ